MNASNVKLPPGEWLKMLLVVAGAVIAPVATGAWFISSLQSNVETNRDGIDKVVSSVDNLTSQIKSLVRHDERINMIEKQMNSLSSQIMKTDDRVDALQFRQNK